MSIQAKVSSLENDVTAVSANEFSNTIVLSEPGQVLLQVEPEDIASLFRDANDLVIELGNGETFRVVNFYSDVYAQPPSRFYLTGAEDQLIPVDLTTLANGEITYVAYYPEGQYAGFEYSRQIAGLYGENALASSAVGGASLAGGTAVAATAAAVGISSSGASASPPPPVDSSEDGVAEPISPDDPVEDDDGDPTAPGELDLPGGPAEPDDPGNSDEPVTPGVPDDPGDSDEPVSPSVPDEPDNPEVPVDPVNPEEPVSPPVPDESGNPEVPSEPVTPGEPQGLSAPTLALANDTSEGDLTTSDGTVMVRSLHNGARWEYSLDGGAAWVDGEGNRFVVPEGEYAQGQVQARQIDAAGTTSAAGVLSAVIVDTTPPPAPTARLANDTGEVEGITSDGRVDVSDIEANTTWWYSLDGGSTWLQGTDSASFSLPEDVYDTRQVLLRQFDIAGNVSAQGNLGAVVVDQTPPQPPTLALASDTGLEQGVTADGRIEIENQEEGAFWLLSLDSGSTWQRGVSSFFILSEGAYTQGQVQVRQIDQAGNSSDATAFGPLTVRLMVDTPDDPALPEAPTLALANDTGDIDGITFDGTVQVGNLIEGGRWEYSLNSGATWQTGVGTQFVLPQGLYAAGQVLVRQTDAAGNESGQRTIGSVLVDATPPEMPSLALANDTGTTNAVTADGTVMIGNLEPNAHWEISYDAGQTWQPGNGDRFILAEGDYSSGQLQVRQVDRAGNTSLAAPLFVTVDVTSPDAPTLRLASDAEVINTTSVAVDNLETGALWEYSLDGGDTWKMGSGNRFDLPEGRVTDGEVLVRQTDGAGNESLTASLRPVIIDITPPSAPVISLVAESGITNDGTVTVEGIEANASWQYSLNAGATWALGEGASFRLPGGEYAAGQILVRQTDSAGNIGEPASLGVIVVNITPPPAPLLTLANDTGDVAGVTADGTVLLGNLDPAARWEYSLDGGASWQPGVGDRFVLAQGAYGEGQVQARQIDTAGNISAVAEFGPVSVDLTLDSPTNPQAPAAPILALDNDTGEMDRITSNGTVQVGGLVEGGTWEYSLNGGTAWVAGLGESFTLTEGNYAAGQVLARQTSPEGLTSATFTLGAVTIDQTAPGVPNVTLNTDTGDIDGMTTDGTVVVDNLDPATFWEYTLDGGSTWQPGTGDRFILPAGSYATGDVRVRQTDGAGNASESGSLPPVTVVTQSPRTPMIELAGEGLTNDATATVNGLLEGATWEYSLDNGVTWQAGQGNTFSMPEGSYFAGQIQVRQTDGAGNISAPGPLGAVVIDLTEPGEPTVALASQAFITRDGTVDVGDLEPGASWEYSLDSGLSWITGEDNGFVLAEGEYQPNQIQVRQVDAAGNVGKPVALGALIVDTTEPAPLTLTLANMGEAPDGAITDGTVQVGNLEPDARWEYSLDSGETWQRGVNDRFVLPQASYAEGQIRARQIDAAGNESPASGLGPVTVDLPVDQPTNPEAPAAPTLSLARATGDVPGVSNSGLVTVSGLLEDAEWQYSLNGGVSWFQGFGASFNVPEGTYLAGQIQARQTASSGLTSPTSTLGTLTVDITAPDRPSATLRNDTGEIEGITTDGTLEIQSLEAGARWEISLNGGATWMFGTGDRFILPEGRYATGDIRLRQTDAAGNVSAESLLDAIEVDNELPDSPTLDLIGGVINNDGTVRVSDIEARARWEYSLDGGTSWTPGRSTSFTVAEGNYAAGAVQVRQTDGAGNVSAPAPLEAFVVDLTPPAAPTVTLVDARAITNEGTVEIGGLEEGATWQYSLDGGNTWQAGAGAGFVLPDAEYALNDVQVRQTDTAGNIGAPASLSAVVVDTTRPDAPTLGLVNDTGDMGDGVTADGTVQVVGLESGGVWEFSLNGGATWQRGLGDRFVLPQGEYAEGQVRVRQFDAAGNVSDVTEFGSVTIDLTIDSPVELEAPGTPTLNLAEDTGEIDGLTRNGTVNVGGLVAGNTWEYSLDGGDTWLGGTGESFSLEEGTYPAGQVQVRQADAEGLTSGIATLGAVTVDTTAPGAPTIALANDTGTLDGVTADGTLLIGNLESNAYWEISLDSGNTWLAGMGERFILPPGSFAPGVIQVRQTDGAGNVSEEGSLEAAVSVVTTPPAMPGLTPVGGAQITNDGTVEVDGIEDGAFWEYTLDNGGTWQAGTGADFVIPEGIYVVGDVQVRQVDGAGNISSPAQVGAIVIDTTRPEAPTATLADDRPVTNDGTVNVGGLEAGATWEFSLNGGDTWQVGAGVSFVIPEDSYPAKGVQVRQIDRAGNVSQAAELGAVTVDVTSPGEPSISLALDGEIINAETVSIAGVEEGATWEYSLNGGLAWQAGGGDSFRLPDGAYTLDAIQVRQYDVAGNVSPVAVLGPVVIDTAAPVAPTLALANDTGGGVTAEGSVLVSGLEPDATWEISLDGGDNWQAGAGTSFVLPEGNYAPEQVLARQTDRAGNTSGNGALDPVNVDVTSPGGEDGLDAPFIILPALVRGFINAETAEDGIELGVMLTPGTQAGDTLTVTVAGTADYDYTVTLEDITEGMMRVELPSDYSDGSYTVVAVIADAAGNASATSNALSFVLDTTAPSDTTTQIVIDSITDDNIINIAEADRSVQITGRVTGEFSPGDVLNLSVNGGEYSASVGPTGAFSVTVLGSLLASATPPEVAFALRASDAAGNVGVIQASHTYAVDLDTPLITIAPLAGDNVLNSQNIANGLVITGPVEGAPEGATVTLSIAGATFEGTVEGTGWNVRVPAAFLGNLANGAFAMVATVTSAAGNVGQSASIEVRLDTLSPTATITVSDTLIGADDEALVTFSFSEAVTDFALEDIQVSGGTLVDLTSQNGLIWTAVFQPGPVSGQASITLPGGTYTDLAGNPGGPASLDGITVDVDAPTLSAIEFAVTDRPLTSAETTEVTFTFSEAVSGLALSDFIVTGGRLSNLSDTNGGTTWTATFRPDGVASSASITLSDGSYTDLAGNLGTGGASLLLAIEILQPVLMIEASEDGWINGLEATGAEVQVGFGGLPVSEGEVVALDVFARAGGELPLGASIATVSYTLTAADIANGYASFSLGIDAEYAFQPAGAQVRIGDSATSPPVDFVIDTVPPGRSVAGGVEVAGNGIALDTLLAPGEGLRLRIGGDQDTLRVLDTQNYPGLLIQDDSGQYVLDLFALALNLQELFGDDPGSLFDLRSLDLQLVTYDPAGNEGEVVTLNDFNILGPVVSLLDFTGSLVGVTDPGASVALSIRLAGVTQTVTVASDANGAFSVDLFADPRLSFSLNDLLTASITAVATDAQGNRSFSPITVNLVDLLPVPLSTLVLSPITDLVSGTAGVVGPLSNIVLPEGRELSVTLNVGDLGSVNVPVSTTPGGQTSLDLNAALNSAVTSLNLLGGVTGLLAGRGATLTLTYALTDDNTGTTEIGTTEVALLGGSLPTLTFGNVRETAINGTSDADVIIVDAGQSVQALGGDDLIVLRSDQFVSIDGGSGTNTLLLEGRLDLDLADLGRISNIQRLNLGNTASTLTLDVETANALASDGDMLQIIGGDASRLTISGAAALGTATVIDGVSYQQVGLGATTVLVNEGMPLGFVPTINQTAGYIVSGGGEAGAIVAVQVGSTTYSTQVNEAGEWRLVLDRPAPANSQIQAVVSGETTDVVTVPYSVAPPVGLQIRTPPLLGLLASFLEGSAPGAQTVRLDVYQDDLFTSLRSSSINVNSNGSFSTNTTVLSDLLNSVTGLLVGNQGVNVGFTAVRSDDSHSTTEVINFGSAESVFANPLGAIGSLLGGVTGGLLGRTDVLSVSGSYYDGSDSADIVQGSARDQTFVTEDGNDVVISIGGRDTIDTGSGDDVIVLRSAQFESINGGEGFDIVALGSGISLNLTSPALGTISNVERISLGRGNGANRLTLDRDALIELTDDDNVLQITGDSQDRVDLAGGNWTRTTTPQSLDGVVFNEYINLDAVLFVEQGINVMEVA
ncbi:Ig-like domain-containing protein [Vreelandella sp. EE22]